MNRLVLAMMRPTGLLWIYMGLLPWLTITVRFLGLSTAFGCCFIFLVLPFFIGMVLVAVGHMTSLPWMYTAALQKRLY